MQDDTHKILDGIGKSSRYHKFFQECAERFPIVIYIMGNHEHYNGDFNLSLSQLKLNLSYLKNVHVLEKQTLVVDDITFIAGTLWTDMNKEDPNTLYAIRNYMNDFQIIKNSASLVHFRDSEGKFKTRVGALTPQDVVEDHKAMLAFIKQNIQDKTKKFVVVGHHAPSKLSTKPRYQKDVMVNGAYSSELSEFILDNPQIKLWTHGHTHDPFDYMIGSTRVVCNPRGYDGHEARADKFELQFIEV
jgi:hypothetical protein